MTSTAATGGGSPTPAVKGYPSTDLSYTTSVNSTFQHIIFLTYFSLVQTNPDRFSVGIQNLASSSGNQIDFTYYVDKGTTIHQIGMVILVYRSTISGYSALGTYNIFRKFDSYTDNFINASTLYSSGFTNGF